MNNKTIGIIAIVFGGLVLYNHSFEFKTNLSLTLQVKHQSAVKFNSIFLFSSLNWFTRSNDHFSPISMYDLEFLFSDGMKNIRKRMLTDIKAIELRFAIVDENLNTKNATSNISSEEISIIRPS